MKAMLTEILTEVKSVKKENAELKAEVEKLKEQPVMKAKLEEPKTEDKQPEMKGVLDMIK